MVTKWLRRNREIHLPLTKRSSRRDYENIWRHLLSRFVSCPALSSNFCNRLLCSNFFTVRKRKVGPKIRLPTHTRTSRLRNRPLGAPLTFHRLDPRPEIRTINPNCISGPRAPFSYFFFFLRADIYLFETDGCLDRFQDVNETRFPEAPERAGTRRRWSSSAPRNSDITLIRVIAPSITCACLAELCSSPARED